jgi:hypothetical protein
MTALHVNGVSIAVIHHGLIEWIDHMVTQATGQSSFSMLAESETKFFPTASDAEIEFVKDASEECCFDKTGMRRRGGRSKKLDFAGFF